MTMKTEMKSAPEKGEAASLGKDLDSTALAAIRDLIATEEDEIAAKAPPSRSERAAKSVSQEKTDAAAVPFAEAESNEQAAARQAVEQTPPQKSPRVAKKDGLAARIKGRITGYRPTPKHIVLAALGLLVVFRPWLVVGVTLLTIFAFIGVFLVLGYDGFWRRAMGLAHWYARRRPSRAAELHRKLDSFALKWDAILDRFPEGTVDGLYLPDFGDLAMAEARHDEALERRLAMLREGEA
ncbi:hypothetical protein AB2B41_22430 [Marimonas sp. MJW-29]|uniref:Uncharacterized protein n=1 Tax=Sulfitobacter sediminis TaxID=3234186 RepID=A0ABV3RUJ5_9RHOB